MEEEKLKLNLNDIYNKFGFGDGDILVDFLGNYPSLGKRCEDLFKLVKHFVEGKEDLKMIISCHNPVRAESYWSDNDINEKDLGTVEVTKNEIIKIINHGKN